jgi:exopolysaccharide production protein ExoQ
MTPLLALAAGVGFAVWLLYRDAKERSSVSPAVWIAVAWVLIYATRPVMSWFADATVPASAESYDEGDLGEALVSLAIIVAGLVVLVRRGVRVSAVIEHNPWLFIVYLFWLHSSLWSDYPMLTIKRLFRDLGNVVMVLLVLTDKNSVEAIKAVCVRCAYVGVPLSVVLIKYYPDLGRVYTGYNQDQLSFVGITANKNTLGMLALVTVIFVLWDFVGNWRAQRGTADWLTSGARAMVMLIGWYLLILSDSATSLVCAVFGVALLLGLDLPFLKRRPGRIEVWGVSIAVALWSLNAGLGLQEMFVQSLGRDMTLTTRTDMWPVLLRMQDSPLLGAGFNTFWAGPRLVQLEQALGGFFLQAHNGYLEMYLNGGLVGVGLLVVLLCMSYRRIREKLVLGMPTAGVRLVMLFVAIAHNCTEATFYKLSLLWFVTVFALMDDPAFARPGASRERQTVPAAAGRI